MQELRVFTQNYRFPNVKQFTNLRKLVLGSVWEPIRQLPLQIEAVSATAAPGFEGALFEDQVFDGGRRYPALRHLTCVGTVCHMLHHESVPALNVLCVTSARGSLFPR